jgi:hypothetical protein
MNSGKPTPPAAEADAELIARLRSGDPYPGLAQMHAAADRITALAAENRTLRNAAVVADEQREALQAERDAAVKDAEMARAILARVYTGAGLYCDDGEIQDNRTHPFIDFKRDSFDDIAEKMMRRAAIAAKL